MEDIEEFLLKLVGIRSETKSEQAISGFLFEHCNGMGFDSVFRDGFGNVFAVVGSGKGRVLNFNAHMDTVTGVVEPRAEGGKVFGRGSADTKGAIAAMLFSAKKLVKEKKKLRGKVVFSFVVCEESPDSDVRARGTKSAIALMKEKGLAPNAVIIGEASQIDLGKEYGVVCRQRGRCTVDIDFFGSSAHGSFGAKKGANSFALASRFCQKLYDYARGLDVSSLSVNIAGGNTLDIAYNKVPRQTSVKLDVRFASEKLLEEAEEKVKAIAEASVKEFAEEAGSMKNSFVSEEDLSSIGFGFSGKELHRGIGNRVYGAFDSSKSGFVEFLAKEAESVLGKAPKMNTSIFGTDAAFYIEAGLFKGIPDIAVFGPGSQLKAHTSDEFVETKHLMEFAELYSRIAQSYLRK